MPKNLPYGRYNLDDQFITALYFQLLNRGSEGENINKSDSTVQVHYVVEGTEEIHLLHWDQSLIDQNQGMAQLSGSPKLKLKQNPMDFIVLFPSDPYFGRASAFGVKTLKKIVVSIPIQRII